MLRDAAEKKLIHGIKIGRKVSPISHLLFADDLLFVRATEEKVENVLEVFSIYKVASGHKRIEKSSKCPIVEIWGRKRLISFKRS